MVIIYCNIYRPKRHISVAFQFSCSIFDGHFKEQNFKTNSSGCVCIKRRTLLQFSEGVNLNDQGIKKIW